MSVARVMFGGLISYGDTLVDFHAVTSKLGLYCALGSGWKMK